MITKTTLLILALCLIQNSVLSMEREETPKHPALERVKQTGFDAQSPRRSRRPSALIGLEDLREILDSPKAPRSCDSHQSFDEIIETLTFRDGAEIAISPTAAQLFSFDTFYTQILELFERHEKSWIECPDREFTPFIIETHREINKVYQNHVRLLLVEQTIIDNLIMKSQEDLIREIATGKMKDFSSIIRASALELMVNILLSSPNKDCHELLARTTQELRDIVNSDPQS